MRSVGSGGRPGASVIPRDGECIWFNGSAFVDKVLFSHDLDAHRWKMAHPVGAYQRFCDPRVSPKRLYVI